MWIFTSSGFLSIVQHKSTPAVLIVRGRVRGDVEKLIPVRSVFEDKAGEHDYRFRSFVERDHVAATIAGHVAEIDYEAFKPSVTDRRRHRAYLEIWDTMAELQDRLAAKPTIQGSFRRTPSGRLVMA